MVELGDMNVRHAVPFCFAAFLFLAGCYLFDAMAEYEADIRSASRGLKSAATDRERALLYSKRGTGYSEKARLSNARGTMNREEYERLFSLALMDFDASIALATAAPQAYLERGTAYYYRAAYSADAADRAFVDKALADFSRAIEIDGGNGQALDMRGLTRLIQRDCAGAIVDFSLEMKVDERGGRLRLAETYCTLGGQDQEKKDYTKAISDYKKAIEMGPSRDGCDCDPYAPLVWLYMQRKDYNKSWEMLGKAKAYKKWIPPELQGELEKASGKHS